MVGGEILFDGGQKWSKVGNTPKGVALRGYFWGDTKGSTLGLLGMILNKGVRGTFFHRPKNQTTTTLTPHQPTYPHTNTHTHTKRSNMSNNYTRVKQTQFTTELEHSYRIRKSAIPDVLTRLQISKTSIITQAWLRTERRETEEGGVYIIRTRVREEEYVTTGETKWEYTTKIYHLNSDKEVEVGEHPHGDFEVLKRTELTCGITQEEYRLMLKLYPNAKKVRKCRMKVLDKSSGLCYDIDTVEGKDYVVVEVEFETEEQAKAYEIPSWIKDNEYTDTDTDV